MTTNPSLVGRPALALTLIIPFAFLASCDQVRVHPEWPQADLSPMTGPQPRGPAPFDPRLVNGSPPGRAPAAGAQLVRHSASPPGDGPQPAQAQLNGDGEYTFDYVDTDIREIVRVILGSILQVNYSIDPSVQGVATVRVSTPVGRSGLMTVLAGVLAQNGATMTNQNGIYRIGQPGAGGASAPIVGAGAPGVGAQVMQLRYASAARLATLLEPYAGEVARVQADTARNALIITGPAAARDNLIELARVFDVDFLAGQSYAMFALRNSDPAKVVAQLNRLLQSDASGALAGAVNVMPIDRARAILVIASQPSYLDRAGRFIAQLDTVERVAGRRLHVYYVQNGQAGDLQPILQRSFGPPTAAQESLPGSLAPGAEPVQFSGQAPGGTQGVEVARVAATSAAPAAPPDPARADAQNEQDLLSEGDGIRIIADRKKNALLIRATDAEYEAIESTIRKLDLLPLQVLIEATIAEVTLNDTLRYGTQFFLNGGGNAAGLTNVVTGQSTLGTVPAAAEAFGTALLAPAFPAFYLARTVGSVQGAIQALQNVTDVKVVSSPKLLILDNENARLQVGDLVPVITQTATAVTSAGAPVINSVEYRETGVILSVRPRVNAGGLVTLDIEQEVSDVVNTTSSTINSPTFQQRKIRSRIVVQDGDTIGLGGLIRDTKTKGNSGVPVLRDIPYLGPLFSTTNDEARRTELLILITPRVMRDQRDALVLTEELRQKLRSASNLLRPLPVVVPVAAPAMPPPPRSRP
jgi:general secretion pathway protein D